jgi:hypothetical protein
MRHRHRRRHHMRHRRHTHRRHHHRRRLLMPGRGRGHGWARGSRQRNVIRRLRSAVRLPGSSTGPEFVLITYKNAFTSVADPGCLSRDPDFYPTRIQKQQQKRGVRKIKLSYRIWLVSFKLSCFFVKKTIRFLALKTSLTKKTNDRLYSVHS